MSPCEVRHKRHGHGVTGASHDGDTLPRGQKRTRHEKRQSFHARPTSPSPASATLSSTCVLCVALSRTPILPRQRECNAEIRFSGVWASHRRLLCPTPCVSWELDYERPVQLCLPYPLIASLAMSKIASVQVHIKLLQNFWGRKPLFLLSENFCPLRLKKLLQISD